MLVGMHIGELEFFLFLFGPKWNKIKMSFSSFDSYMLHEWTAQEKQKELYEWNHSTYNKASNEKNYKHIYTHTQRLYVVVVYCRNTEGQKKNRKYIYIARYKRKIPTLYYFGKYVEWKKKQEKNLLFSIHIRICLYIYVREDIEFSVIKM